MTDKQIFEALQRASDLRDEANKLIDKVMVALLQKTTNATIKTDNLISTLVAPEKGDIYNINDLSQILKMSKATIYNLCNQGKLPHHKPGKRKIIFYRHEISEFLKATQSVARIGH